MKKIAVVFASAGLMALAACGERPANETANASNAVVENVVENAVNAADNAANAADNAANAANNTANAM
ncbi:hypothetical protein FHS51_000389 [Sphingobium wenxiniae]|uniref:Circumsporozoite protein n=1 Tax=Sphingobium wenxiniae (strain DSM 21828 / CGMCC 1.7748 / JZ-1) TaxID=595605 RepID=A0A562KPZ1_SPHWJ|nr:MULTISPECIES: hypothetical protein [Sphingobium]MBB6190186.1 hypothetical protein [Sphingobium wenxiniae]TWH97499.1 hypothetical protein IQ35_00095 [Sphingobium wenxiniae]WRD77449.1 hypothetical protein QQ987_04800 [Sphingobium baderi]